MVRDGHMDIGVPSAIVAIVAVVTLLTGGSGFPLWVRVLLIGTAVVFGGLALLVMATPRWPSVSLEGDGDLDGDGDEKAPGV